MHRIAVLASLLAWLSPPMAEGSFALQPNVTQERYQVVLLTIDQGDDLWERFGHNAILIRDRSTGQDLAWNWGLYNFEDADFLPRFLRGTMRYTMGPALLEPFLARHRETNRTVYANEILVTQAEAGELDELVRRNFEPGNREYVYHYFLDNCSTRARDILDVALGGILSERFSEAITPMSYRWHTRRLVQQTAWIDQGLSFLLGTRGDPPRTQWDAMFIPMEMMRILEDFGRSDGLGGTTPLLGPRQVLVQATRSVAPEAPPSFRFIWLGLGLGSAALFLTLGSSAGRGSRTAKLALAGTVGVWGLFSGLLGALLLAAWFTDHDFIQWNANIFQLSPLALPLMVTGVLALTRETWGYGGLGRVATRLAVLIGALSVFAGLLQLSTIIRQGNAEALAVGVPTNVAVAVALLTAMRSRRG